MGRLGGGADEDEAAEQTTPTLLPVNPFLFFSVVPQQILVQPRVLITLKKEEEEEESDGRVLITWGAVKLNAEVVPSFVIELLIVIKEGGEAGAATIAIFSSLPLRLYSVVQDF